MQVRHWKWNITNAFQASPIKKPINRKRRNVRKHGRCAFIDDEAAVSGDESSDEDMGGFLTQIDASTCQDEGDPNIDMHAKYLQSVMYGRYFKML